MVVLNVCHASSDHTQPPNIVATINSLLNQVQGSFNLNRSNSDQPSDRLCFIHTSIDSHSVQYSVLVASVSNIGIVCNRKQGNFQPAMAGVDMCSTDDIQDDVTLLTTLANTRDNTSYR